MIISIDTDRVAKLKVEGDKIVLEPEGEETLIELFKLQETIEEAIKSAKEKIKTTALALNPNFTSIQGDKVKVAFRSYGSRFKIDLSRLQELPKEFYDVKTTYSPNIKNVEEFIDQNGAPPLGILENEREKQLQVTIKGAKHE